MFIYLLLWYKFGEVVIMENVITNIKRLREMFGLTQEELGKIAGVTKSILRNSWVMRMFQQRIKTTSGRLKMMQKKALMR